MKKTKLFTSIAAFVLVLGLGACETTSEEETTPEESEGTTQTTDTTSESTSTTPSGDPDGYVLVGDFTDSNWDAKPAEDSKYYIPLTTTEYKVTVTIADEPDYGENDPWSAGLRVVEWGDSWNLVVGSDDLAEGSAEGLYGDDSKNIKVSWGETYDITVTFGDTNSILVTVHEDSENEGEVQQASLLGSFNFATNEKNGVGISSSSDLDEFWTGDADLYRGVSEYDTVYLGNGTGGAFENVTTLIKFGTGSANGKLQLKFAAGTCISEVVVTAHSWYKISDEYPEQEPNQLVVNGTSQDCSVSGTATELRYEITDDLERYVTFESVGRVTIHSIDIYGTYEPEKLETVTLSLSATTTELMVGASTDISVSYLPENAVFDEEDLVWSSSDETVATVDTGTVTGVGAGSATITATSSLNSAITASLDFTIAEATAKILNYSYTFKSGDLGANSSGSTQGQRQTEAGTTDSLNGLVWSYSAALYKGWDSNNNKGIQIGAGNSLEAQTTDPFTLSTDFGETVKLTSITLKLGVASSGGGKYSIALDSNAVATDKEFTTAAITDYTHDNLSFDGQKLEISLLSTKEKAMYIQGISFTIEVDLNSTLNFGE